MRGGKIIVVEEIVRKVDTDEGFLFGRTFSEIDNLFKAPMPSSQLEIYCASGPLSRQCFQYETSMVLSKCIRTEVNDKKFAIIPLLHSI